MLNSSGLFPAANIATTAMSVTTAGAKKRRRRRCTFCEDIGKSWLCVGCCAAGVELPPGRGILLRGSFGLMVTSSSARPVVAALDAQRSFRLLAFHHFTNHQNGQYCCRNTHQIAEHA